MYKHFQLHLENNKLAGLPLSKSDEQVINLIRYRRFNSFIVNHHKIMKTTYTQQNY